MNTSAETSTTSSSLNIAILEGQLLAGEIDRAPFISRAVEFGLPAQEAQAAANKFLAIGANQAARRANLEEVFDYIVVGSGASGAVVASRLATHRHNKVLLLEAGGADLTPPILTPESWFINQGTQVDWAFKAEPGRHVNNRSIMQAAGRVLGGSTSINGMVWARGHMHDFDLWAQESGDESWGYRHVLDVYKRIEDWHGVPDPARRGRGGNVFVQPAPNPNPLAPAFVRAAESIGIKAFDDHNGIMMEGPGGAAITNVRIREGRRLSTSASYLYPVMDQPNLTVLTGARVNRVIIEGNTATAVEVLWQNEVRTIRASSEIVLSAGALQTPKILMLSGIGDRSELARFGIRTVAHVPGVGRNFQDHPMIAATLWEPRVPLAVHANAAEANLFAKSRPDLNTPDLHIFQIEVPYLSEATAKYAVTGAWSINPGLVRPADPRKAPEIHANMLSDRRDLAALRKAMEISRELGNSRAMEQFVKREILPGDREGEALDDLIRDGATSMHHPAGTAKMGRDDSSVVDSRLRVYGVNQLRVADASVMPQITTGNTQAPSVLIGERMAEILTGDQV
jgi:choline dehydrogenase